MKIQSISLLLAATLVLGACGGGAGTNTGSNAPAADLPPPATSSSVASSASSKTSSAVASSAVSSAASVVAVVFSSSSSSKSSSSSSSSVAISSSTSSSSKSNSSLASSSAKSSSASAIASCVGADGSVFIDSVCSGWRNVSYFELKKGVTYVGETEDGSPGQLLTLSTINTGEAGHNQVLDIAYNGNNEYNAIARIRNPESATTGVDMSAYATGKLVFDLKVISAGDAKEPLQLVLDCGYPCQNTEYLVKTNVLNQWKTIEVSVADMIANGLDIKHIYTGFQLSPPWDLQKNVHFQVDNIRWVKGPQVTPTTEVCYAQYFDRKDWTYGVRTENFYGSTATATIKAIAPVSLLSPVWFSPADTWGYINAPVNDADYAKFGLCLYKSTKMSYSVYVPAAYVADGKMRVGLVFRDYYGHIATSYLKSASELKPDDWNTVEVDIHLSLFNVLGSAAGVFSYDATFKPNEINHVGVYFDANGKPASVTGDLRVDNIVMRNEISEPDASGPKCDAGKQTFSGTTPVGLNFAANQALFLRADLKNATLAAGNISLSSANTTSFLSQNTSNSFVFQVTASNNGFLSSELLQSAFSYQATDANLSASVTYSVYSTLSAAINATNDVLSKNTISLVSGVACSSSSRSSSSVATSSSAKSSSSNSSVKSSSSTSSSASSISSSSKSSVASSSSSSPASNSSSSKASCSVGAKIDASSPTVGFGINSGARRYVAVKLTNATFVSPGAQLSLPNGIVNVVSSNSSRIIFDITATDSIPSSTTMSLSFGFQQTDVTSSVTREIKHYETATAAVNDANVLSSSSTTIANAGSCGL